MFQGFYKLASGMLTQNKQLTTIANNMANATTPGYKRDDMTSTTFGQVMLARSEDNRNASQVVGEVNMIKVPEEIVTNYSTGNYMETGENLDFAIQGDGFFRVRTAQGEDVFTRNGSFYMDDGGYLSLKGIGRVQGSGGDIYLDSDHIGVDTSGNIYTNEGELIDNLDVVDFADYTLLSKGSNATFRGNQQPIPVANPKITKGMLENSNIDTVELMQDMIATQRAFQSSSQMIKIYDGIMAKASTEIASF